jgi:lipoprotein-releasing system permease protein
MPWYLHLALRQLFPKGRRFPFFTFMSGLGVAVGVMMLVVSTSVMGGFGQGIRAMIIDTQGEIQVDANGAVIDDAAPLLALIERQSGVAAASPYARGVVAVQCEGRPSYPAIQGVDLARVGRVSPLSRYMVQGTLDDLDDDSVILSLQLARSLGPGWAAALRFIRR